MRCRHGPPPAASARGHRVVHPLAPTLTLSEIARWAALPLATAHRIVGTLTRWGALERDDGGYHVGLRLWEVAALAPRGLGLRASAMPFLEDLYAATHENVQLAVRAGHEVVYIERISGRSAVGVLSRVGARWPLHATGVGLVLLAHSSADVQNDVCARPSRRSRRTPCRTRGDCGACSPRCAGRDAP